jgi:hypothetical protein
VVVLHLNINQKEREKEGQEDIKKSKTLKLKNQEK